MSHLNLNATYDFYLKSTINKVFHDCYEGSYGQMITLEFEKQFDAKVTFSLIDKLAATYGLLDFKFVISIDLKGILNITPSNLFTLCAVNGYYIDPKLLPKDVNSVTINGAHTFKVAPRKKSEIKL